MLSSISLNAKFITLCLIKKLSCIKYIPNVEEAKKDKNLLTGIFILIKNTNIKIAVKKTNIEFKDAK